MVTVIFHFQTVSYRKCAEREIYYKTTKNSKPKKKTIL